MKLTTADEAFIESQIEGVRRAIQERAHGEVDRAWTLGRRLSKILVAEAHDHLASVLGLVQAERYDTMIEVYVDGTRHAVYEAGVLRTEIWVALIESSHSVIDGLNVRVGVMSSDRIGDDALPPFIDREGNV